MFTVGVELLENRGKGQSGREEPPKSASPHQNNPRMTKVKHQQIGNKRLSIREQGVQVLADKNAISQNRKRTRKRKQVINWQKNGNQGRSIL